MFLALFRKCVHDSSETDYSGMTALWHDTINIADKMAQTRKYLAPEPNEFMVSTVNVLRSAYMVLESISVIQL